MNEKLLQGQITLKYYNDSTISDTYNLSSRLKSSWTSVSLWLMRSLCVVAGLLVTSKRSNHGRFFFIVNKVWFRPAYNDNKWFIITVRWALLNISSLFKCLLCYICIRNLPKKCRLATVNARYIQRINAYRRF